MFFFFCGLFWYFFKKNYSSVLLDRIWYLEHVNTRALYPSSKESVTSQRHWGPRNEVLDEHVDENKIQWSPNEMFALLMQIQDKLDIQGDEINVIQYQVNKIAKVLGKMAKKTRVTNRGKECPINENCPLIPHNPKLTIKILRKEKHHHRWSYPQL